MPVWFVVLGDTVVYRQVPVPPTGWQTVTGVAGSIVSVIFCLFAVATIPGVFLIHAQLKKGVEAFRKGSDAATQALGRAQSQAGPLLADATVLVADLRRMASAVREDVDTVHRAVQDTDARLRALAATVEGRLGEFDAVARVLQDEIEQALVSAAAVARGVRAGTDALAGRPDPHTERDNGHATDSSRAGAPSNGHNDARDDGTGRARPRIRRTSVEG
jgi:hypothetical protein